LRCIDSDQLYLNNHIKCTAAALLNQQQVITQIANNARKPFQLGFLTAALSNENTKTPRPQIFFGSVKDYLDNIAKDHDTKLSILDDTVTIAKIQSDVASDTPLVISPGEGGLIGTPQQTNDGIMFSVLLNPKIRIFKPKPMLVKLDMSKLTDIKQIRVSQNNQFARLSQDGVYKILGVLHIGDTRGNAWESQIVACNSPEGQLSAMFETVKHVPE
jgi:hypothetical protein